MSPHMLTKNSLISLSAPTPSAHSQSTDQATLTESASNISQSTQFPSRRMHSPAVDTSQYTYTNDVTLLENRPNKNALTFITHILLLHLLHYKSYDITRWSVDFFDFVLHFITSYEVVLADIRRSLKHYNWKYVVIDEVRKCNNEEMKAELEETKRAQVIAKLHAILRPFILRRIKADVEQMLPRKNEIILYATMTEYQNNFQDHLINKTLGSYLINTKAETVICAKLNAYNLMIQLRKNCNHPDLLESVFDDSCISLDTYFLCGKFFLLDRLLTKLFALGHKVLIFSQWVNVLDIMDYYFSEKGFEVCIIDGNVKLEVRRRQVLQCFIDLFSMHVKHIQDFNDMESRFGIFLLSTRASGLGINLTAADTCILYDSDWNPQMDLKAMDRCHRIGQTKPVHVYSFATAQSEDILALLRDEETTEDKMIQTDITDEDLNKVLDHSDLFNRKAEDDETNGVAVAFPMKGPGWEVVIPTTTGGMLSSLNN
ncbi:hypothetical protein UlMin_044483 [Ulmus minor]